MYQSLRPENRRIENAVRLLSLVALTLLACSSASVQHAYAQDPQRWQQILASPRIGDRLTTVAVDRDLPRRIFVGTEEGAVLRSTDGGITWQEFETGPFTTPARSVTTSAPSLPTLGFFRAFGLAAPFRPSTSFPDRVPFSTYYFSVRPEFIRPSTPISTFSPVSRSFLFSTVAERNSVPVRQIEICPGATYGLLVATSDAVFGSPDDGYTYTPLLRVPGARVKQVRCASWDANYVVASTEEGPYRSLDGGVTWNLDISGASGRRGSAMAFGRRGELFIAGGDQLYGGNPDEGEGVQLVYPDFNNSATAPWTEIHWVESESDDIWLGTDDGLRRSSDHGGSFDNVARELFARHRIEQVVVGANDGGGRRIAVIVRETSNVFRQGSTRSSHVVSSDDGGETWEPFFQGMTRRTIQQMASAPALRGTPARWWIVSGGELWATVVPSDHDGAVNRAAIEWAEDRYRVMPSLHQTMEGVFARQRLREQDLRSSLVRPSRALPELLLRFSYETVDQERAQSVLVGSPRNVGENIAQTNYFVGLRLQWNLGDLLSPRTDQGAIELDATRNALYEVRRRVGFATEDAWHERRLLLERLRAGMSDPLQIEILRERILVLESLLEIWLGEPLANRLEND